MLAHIPTVTTLAGLDSLTSAVAVLAGGLGALVLATVRADRGGLLSDSQVPFRRWIAIVVGGLSIGAASIHVAVIGAHFAEYPPFGVAFVALALFQVAWAVAYVLAPKPRVAIAAIVVNAGALLVWAISRSVGLPFGPESGQVEPVGPLDVAAGVMEATLIAVLAWDLASIGRRLRPSLPRAGAVIVLGSSTLAVALLTTAALVVAGGDPHGGVGHAAQASVGVAPVASASPASQQSSAAPSSLVVVDPPASAPTSNPAGSPSSTSPPNVAPSAAETSSSLGTPSMSPSPSARATPRPATPAPLTPSPTRAPTPPPAVVANPGQIRFGSTLDPEGEIVTPTNRFGEGQSAVWIAEFTEAPAAPTIRWLIVQVLPDGREFEHWREDISLADRTARRLVGGVTLSVYVHGGEGNYRMRYLRGDELLAEGAFEFVP